MAYLTAAAYPALEILSLYLIGHALEILSLYLIGHDERIRTSVYE